MRSLKRDANEAAHRPTVFRTPGGLADSWPAGRPGRRIGRIDTRIAACRRCSHRPRVMMRALAESPLPAGEDATKPAAVVKYGLA
jgi:hypothetical protein